MPYEHVIETCLAAAVGEGGLSEAEFAQTLGATRAGLEDLRLGVPEGRLPALAIAGEQEDLGALGEIARRLRGEFERVVVLGTGGSSLGGQAIAGLAADGLGPAAAAPRVDFIDNIDPRIMRSTLAALDLERTAFLVISKSGTTVETLAQTMVCAQAVHAACGEGGVARRFVCITEAADSPLRRLAGRLGIEVLDHDPGIAGRYSVLTRVGLLPALILGLDARALRAGAAEVLEATLAANAPADSPPAAGAALAVALGRHRGIAIHVLMPYAGSLAAFAMWHRQLWAESLGKRGLGTTPAPALGPVDQHSQLQLYLEGPADKLFTLIVADAGGLGPRIDGAAAEDPELAYLRGRTLGDLVAAEQRATLDALVRHGRPTRELRLRTVDERTLGGLFMHFMLETVLAAHLLDLDPFDQPAVEAGKTMTRELLAGGAGR